MWIHTIICFLKAKNETPPNIHQQLWRVYGANTMSIKKVQKWKRLFKEGRENIHNEERSGWPSDVVNKNSTTAVQAIVKADVRVTIDKNLLKRGNEHCIDVSKGSVYTIMHNELGYSKICPWWVPRL